MGRCEPSDCGPRPAHNGCDQWGLSGRRFSKSTGKMLEPYTASDTDSTRNVAQLVTVIRAQSRLQKLSPTARSHVLRSRCTEGHRRAESLLQDEPRKRGSNSCSVDQRPESTGALGHRLSLLWCIFRATARRVVPWKVLVELSGWRCAAQARLEPPPPPSRRCEP